MSASTLSLPPVSSATGPAGDMAVGSGAAGGARTAGGGRRSGPPNKITDSARFTDCRSSTDATGVAAPAPGLPRSDDGDENGENGEAVPARAGETPPPGERWLRRRQDDAGEGEGDRTNPVGCGASRGEWLPAPPLPRPPVACPDDDVAEHL